MPMVENSDNSPRSELLERRMYALKKYWRRLKEKWPIELQYFELHPNLLRETVEDYLDDRDAYIQRRKIDKRIKLHKIAGLMAASICKNRPVQLSLGASGSVGISRANELLALHHGVATCAESYGGTGAEGDLVESLARCSFFDRWRKEVLYHFHRRPDSAESVILLFELISLHYFPKAIDD